MNKYITEIHQEFIAWRQQNKVKDIQAHISLAIL